MERPVPDFRIKYKYDSYKELYDNDKVLLWTLIFESDKKAISVWVEFEITDDTLCIPKEGTAKVWIWLDESKKECLKRIEIEKRGGFAGFIGYGLWELIEIHNYSPL